MSEESARVASNVTVLLASSAAGRYINYRQLEGGHGLIHIQLIRSGWPPINSRTSIQRELPDAHIRRK